MKKLIAMILCLCMVASVCSAFADVIKLGGLAPITGNYSEYGIGFKTTFEMAVNELNAAGGVNGYTFEIDVKDTEGEPTVATNMATAFAEDDGVYAILGDFTSGCSKANYDVCENYGILQLSPSASASDYAGMSQWFFSINGRQDVEAPFVAKYVVNKYMGCKTCAIVQVENDWGVTSFSNFAAMAEKVGLEIVAHETYMPGETDFSSIVTKVRAANPECLVVFDQGDCVAAIFNQADTDGWNVKHVTLGSGTSDQLLSQLLDPNNIISTSPYFFEGTDEAATAWYNEFVSKTGFAPTVQPVFAYDCVYLIAKAVESIGDGEVTRASLRDALQAIDFTGMTGRIQFSEDGDIARAYMICGGSDQGWSVLEGLDYGAEGL